MHHAPRTTHHAPRNVFRKFRSVVLVLLSLIIWVGCEDEIKVAQEDFDKEASNWKEHSEKNGLGNNVMPNGDSIDLIDLLGTACVPENYSVSGCNDTLFLDTLIIDNLNSYPGCSFAVVFEFYRCEDLFFGFQDITVGDFQIVDHDCDSFSNDIENSINETINSDFVIDFELEMLNAIEIELIEREFTDTARFNCGQAVYWNINFIRASCYTIAGYGVSDPPIYGQGSCKTCDPRYTYAKITCGSQCCERHTRVCREADGSLRIETYDATNPFTIDCSDEAFLDEIPYYFYVLDEPCRVMCPDS